MKGLGQGLVGVAAQPVSGALDFMSSAFEGIDASSNTILGKLSNHPRAVKRRRLPRSIGGDRKLQPFLRTGSDAQVPTCHCANTVLTNVQCMVCCDRASTLPFSPRGSLMLPCL